MGFGIAEAAAAKVKFFLFEVVCLALALALKVNHLAIGRNAIEKGISLIASIDLKNQSKINLKIACLFYFTYRIFGPLVQ